jgi:hypothetical protein
LSLIKIFFFKNKCLNLGYVHITESTYLLVECDEFQFEEGPPYNLPGNGNGLFISLIVFFLIKIN